MQQLLLLFFWPTYFLNTIFISLFECEDLIGSLLRIINLLPRLILLLFKQGNSIRQKLSVTFDARSEAAITVNNNEKGLFILRTN